MAMPRELMLNQMRLFKMPNERTAKFCVNFLKHFKMPIRLLNHKEVLELGGNSSHPIEVALRLLREKNIKPLKELPWKPPAILHDDYKAEARRNG